MPSLVIIAVERPLDLIGVANGEIDPGLLVPVGPRGQLHHLAARAWLSLCRAAEMAGWSLTYTYGGTYRPLIDQELLFHQRYTTVPLPGRPTKLWKGETWYQRPNTAMAAVPGTSNHGLGLAIDAALGPDPAHAVSIMPAIDWMADHAPRFGFSWESLSEPWHLRLVTGDHVQQAVIDWEPHDDPPPPPEEDDMARNYVVVGNSDFPGPQRYLDDGISFRLLLDEDDFHDVVKTWGLDPIQHPDPTLALATPRWKTGTWIAARLKPGG